MKHSRTNRPILIGITKALILHLLPSVIFAQDPGREKTPISAPSLVPPPHQTSSEKTQAASQEETKPLYGYQGVLVETLDGKTVATQSANQTFNPASAIKLATALVALQTLGPQQRFATAVWTDGILDKTTGTLNGNLYLSGRDTSLHYEHAVMIAREL